MVPPASARPDLPALTGLRFWAAFAILTHHLLLGIVPRDTEMVVPMLAACGTLGMNLFFVLSGFIIHYNYQAALSDFQGRSVYTFLVARVARLYPLYIVLFLLDFLLTRSAHGRFSFAELMGALPYFLTLSQSWMYQQLASGSSVTYMFPKASISWSVSTEMLMYAFYPLLLALLVRDRSPGRARALWVSISALLIALGLGWIAANWPMLDRLGIALFGEKASLASNYSYSFANWLGFLSPYVRIWEFIIGMLAAHLYLGVSAQAPTGGAARALGLAGWAAFGFILLTFLPAVWAQDWVKKVMRLVGYTPFIGLLIYACARLPQASIARLFALRPFVTLGEYSYSIYLFHIFVLPLLVKGPLSQLPTGVKTALFMLIVLSCARLLYQWIEAPWRKRLRQSLTPLWPATREPVRP